jgi:hypothetical protein
MFLKGYENVMFLVMVTWAYILRVTIRPIVMVKAVAYYTVKKAIIDSRRVVLAVEKMEE